MKIKSGIPAATLEQTAGITADVAARLSASILALCAGDIRNPISWVVSI